MNAFIAFVAAVMANVVSDYIRKWFNSNLPSASEKNSSAYRPPPSEST